VLRTKDFYEILGVSKSATEEDLKKSYKKLALKLHPDKNKAPKSEEAFKILARAYTCLTNAEKR
jgi:DnaJ family protein B protein 12